MKFRMHPWKGRFVNQIRRNSKNVIRQFVFTLFLIASLASCRKVANEAPPSASHPRIVYKDLKEAEVKYPQTEVIDIDNDSIADFVFGVVLAGDPVLQRDRKQFIVNSGIKRNLLNNASDQSPMLNRMDTISKKHQGYLWWEISSILLAEKIVSYSDTTWPGLWKNASHNYLPIQVEKIVSFIMAGLSFPFPPQVKN